MAQQLDDGEFWLPSEFLTDDELLSDFKSDGFVFGGFGSDLSSPVESVVGSNETESDEEEFISGLTRRLASSTLQDSGFSDFAAKGRRLSSSPQSTLCGFKPGSSRGSPQVSSPPDSKEAVGWNLIYAAAEEVARMRRIEEATAFYSSFAPVQKPAGLLKNPNQSTGFYPTHTHTQSQAQAQAQARFSYQQQIQAAQFQEQKIGYNNFQNGRRNAPGYYSPAWPTLQQSQNQPRQRPASGMRAVFLRGDTGARKERTGTGVFLPRRLDDCKAINASKKPGCPVLLPEKVVHALNLNLDSMDSTAPVMNRENRNFEYAMKQKMMTKNLRPMPIPQQPAAKQELSLPQEWTY